MSSKKFLVVGDTRNKYGRYLLNKFEKYEQIQFIGPIYNNIQKIHTLRTFSYLYFHGHSVGGTNPSLLEAMASRSLVAAHKNKFNKAILQGDAYYFSHASEVKNLIEKTIRGEIEFSMIKNNLLKMKQDYPWEKIIEEYNDMILKSLQIKTAESRQAQSEKVVA
jgi:glycosyltransferase involved in cell wall biosynthesis